MANHHARVPSQLIGQGIQFKCELSELRGIGWRPGSGWDRVLVFRADGRIGLDRVKDVIDPLLARMPRG
jgi:hypothetical protein